MSETLPPLLHSERLTLRPLGAGDAPALFAIFSDPAVVRYWSRGAWTDMAQAEEMLVAASQGYADGSALRFGIVLTRTDELVGTASLFGVNRDNRRCEIGYALGSSFWGQGIVSEALPALVEHAFEGLGMNRIEADIDPRNIASGRVLEKLGFRQEGYMPERWIVAGETTDTAFYGLLKRGWEAHQRSRSSGDATG
ncbi:GNAT family N-acetyltransferase [Massilia sp. Dwa41.01b]|uniref:GNAT family N-acetyltransferase n=1 Tax=unclassified Massilia TaxID=2609279 RepID=UPI0015FEC214|nr:MULTISPECIES: GNAT family N-acetyltransferase [unclassified Massilia]QNA88112.1 GNAT family N-acetyltransferase [Massilia sp. Dwa41.01b]QNA99021.1 GNAT family N-acetyltransferase [Massilia sp. Se16.2.3]